MTNFEKIKNMSRGEMATFLLEIVEDYDKPFICEHDNCDKDISCILCYRQWLSKEADNNV